MVFSISAGSMRNSSLSIPSGPGDSLLLRVLMHSLKALLSRIEECSPLIQQGSFLTVVQSRSGGLIPARSLSVFKCNF